MILLLEINVMVLEIIRSLLEVILLLEIDVIVLKTIRSLLETDPIVLKMSFIRAFYLLDLIYNVKCGLRSHHIGYPQLPTINLYKS